MNQIAGKIFIAFGIFLIAFSVVLFGSHSIDLKLGMFWNITLFAWDCIWFIGTGCFLVISGVAIHKREQEQLGMIKAGGDLIIFNLVFFIFSFVFNRLVGPVFQSNGRIFTYCFQSVSRLLNPSFLPDFLVPFGSIVTFIVISVLYKRCLSKLLF